MTGFIDVVVSGPDISGTSTQVHGLKEYLEKQNYKVRDLRGTEIDALFHAEKFRKLNQDHSSLKEFLASDQVTDKTKRDLLFEANKLLIGGNTNQDLKVASCLENGVSTYINPDSADVWIMEEPTKRGAGQVNRTIEQQRSKYNSEMNPMAAALTHQVYRTDEFLRFRQKFRENNKIILRSRSEESACYQIKESGTLPGGIDRETYINLPGHQIAFANPPTHLFIVCAKPDWTPEEYLELREQRSKDRALDDHEKHAEYQTMLNKRYATSWIKNLYLEACTKYESIVPKIQRFDIYKSKEQIKSDMNIALQDIMRSYQA